MWRVCCDTWKRDTPLINQVFREVHCIVTADYKFVVTDQLLNFLVFFHTGLNLCFSYTLLCVVPIGLITGRARLSVCLSVHPSPSLLPSVHLSSHTSFKVLTWKRRGVERPKLVWTFPKAGATGLPIFKLKRSKITGHLTWKTAGKCAYITSSYI